MERDITNLKTDYQTIDTYLRDGENDVLLFTMKYVIAAHLHPPCGWSTLWVEEVF